MLRDWHNFYDRDSSSVARSFFWRRGFALTGKESYLESYRANVARSEQKVGVARDLTVDNATQQRQIPILERLARGRAGGLTLTFYWWTCTLT